MHPDDRDKTTFTCHVGTFRFKCMPFGLRNAPSTFQRAMDVILSGVRWQKCYCVCYLDDIIVLSSSMESHVEDLDKVLSLLRNAGVSLRLDKCHFFRRRVNYLGHVTEPGKLSVQATKVDTILKA
jgi:Reverse transcriptase (RNA-dependent DNA polymerase)